VAWLRALSLVLLCTCTATVNAALTAALPVSASIVAGCLVNSTGGLYGTLSFGTYSALSTAPVTVALAGGVTLQCTPGVSVSGRHLKMGSGTAQIAYQLFQDAARTQSLGIAQSVNVPYTNANAISLPIYGYVVLPGNQPAGTYSDTLQVQISY